MEQSISELWGKFRQPNISMKSLKKKRGYRVTGSLTHSWWDCKMVQIYFEKQLSLLKSYTYTYCMFK